MCARSSGPRHEDRLCGRLVGVQQPPDRRRAGRGAVQPRSAVVGPEYRFHRHRQLHAAADWRDGTAQLDYDATNGPTTIHDRDYLTANIRGGEDYDWYYASPADRDAQTRTPITDGLGKPWVWRAKDLWSWWSNAHYDRPAGSESASPTAWTPQGKPIWFCELGCPAIDKGANEPNVFFDPKSSESAAPYYSNGQRDDLIQRLFLEAHLAFWNDGANNPISSVYGGRMVDTARIFAWCWDARPFPFFPARADIWGDAANYRPGPLAERTPRRGAARRSGERALRGCGVLRHRRVQSLGSRHRFRRHRHDEPARCDRAARPRLFLRRRGERRRDPLHDARTAGCAGARRRRHRAARRRAVLRLLVRARAGNRSAGRLAHRLYRCRCRLPPGGRRGAASHRLVGPRRELDPAAGARPGAGHRHRPAPADGCVGRCARAPRSRWRRRSSRSIPPTRCCSMPAGARGGCASPKSTMRGARQMQAIATDPSIYEADRRAAARAGRDPGPGVHGPRARGVSRPAAAHRQRNRLGAACRRVRQPVAGIGARAQERERCELHARHRAHACRNHRRDDGGFLFRSDLALGQDGVASGAVLQWHARLAGRSFRARRRERDCGRERRRRMGSAAIRKRRTDRAQPMGPDADCCAGRRARKARCATASPPARAWCC